MASNLPTNLATQKNKLEQDTPWIMLVEVDLDGTLGRFTNNNEDIIFESNTYTPLPMEISTITQDIEGSIPGVSLSLSNVHKGLLPYLEALSGLVNSTMKLIVVNTAYLAENYAELTMNFTIMSSSVNDEWIVFQLGAPSPFNKRYPMYRYIAKYCNWGFKSAECAYSGGDLVCLRTFSDCQTKGNLSRFGGYYGLREDGFRIV